MWRLRESRSATGTTLPETVPAHVANSCLPGPCRVHARQAGRGPIADSSTTHWRGTTCAGNTLGVPEAPFPGTRGGMPRVIPGHPADPPDRSPSRRIRALRGASLQWCRLHRPRRASPAPSRSGEERSHVAATPADLSARMGGIPGWCKMPCTRSRRCSSLKLSSRKATGSPGGGALRHEGPTTSAPPRRQSRVARSVCLRSPEHLPAATPGRKDPPSPGGRTLRRGHTRIFAR